MTTDAAETPPRGRAASKARTHENLLRAATKVFADRGYGAASVEEIAREAGVSVGSVYTHFESKRKLFMALMDAHLDHQVDLAHRYTDQGVRGATDELDVSLRAADDDEHLGLLIGESFLYAARHMAEDPAIGEYYERVYDSTAALLATERRKRDATWSLTDDEAAVVVAALFHGLIQHRRLAPHRFTERLYGRAVAALFRGLETPEED